MMKRIALIALMMAIVTPMMCRAQAQAPKHEFRGAWMHIIGQEQYAAMQPDAMRDYLVDQLDKLQQAGCNAIVWQIRPQADAGYPQRARALDAVAHGNGWRCAIARMGPTGVHD